MKEYINISWLNDFIFCPYSIYLHNVYYDTDDELFHAAPQTKGRAVHKSVDTKQYSTRKTVLSSLSITSEKLGLVGKIDLYYSDEQKLVERKNNLKKIYRGQLYQLWSQYVCMVEMGYIVKEIAFYEISTNKMIDIDIPTSSELLELEKFINSFRNYDPTSPLVTNINKCTHCIYCNICEKTELSNVYD